MLFLAPAGRLRDRGPLVDTSEVPPTAAHTEFTAPLVLIVRGEVCLFRSPEEVALDIEPVDALAPDTPERPVSRSEGRRPWRGGRVQCRRGWR